MSKGKAARLQERRHKGDSPAPAAQQNESVTWGKTHFPIRRNQEGLKTGISDPNRFVNSRRRSIMQ